MSLLYEEKKKKLYGSGGIADLYWKNQSTGYSTQTPKPIDPFAPPSNYQRVPLTNNHAVPAFAQNAQPSMQMHGGSSVIPEGFYNQPSQTDLSTKRFSNSIIPREGKWTKPPDHIDPYENSVYKEITGRAKTAADNIAKSNKTWGSVAGAGQALQSVRPGIRASNVDYSPINSTIQSGLGGLGNIGISNSTLSPKATGALSAGSAVAGIGGDLLANDKHEEAGGILAGAASGAAAGAMLGPWGAVAGGVIGGAMGAFGGAKKRKARRKREKAEHMAEVKADERTNIENHNRSVQQASNLYDQYGNRIGVARNGLKITAKTSYKLKVSVETGLIPLQKAKEVTTFKRGGKTALNKENIIPDGPTHGQLNKTNIKKDKGLAIVEHGNKEYEIEKEELVLNLRATEIVEKLCKRYKKDNDKKHLVALGKLMKRELMNNTYDYTKKFGVNKGKALKDINVNGDILATPKKGSYTIKEKDVKADGNKMQVLGNGGEVLSNLDRGARIFSRPHTKKLIDLAKTAKNKDGLLELGKFMDKVINTQNTQEKQYVET